MESVLMKAQKQRMKLSLIIVVVLVVLTGCRSEASTAGAPTMEDPEGTAQPTLPPPSAVRAVAADGQLASPYPSLALGFGGGVSGQVVTITVQSGEVIAAGDLLALLDDTELRRSAEDARITRDRARADLLAAQAQWERDLADAEQSLATAERNLTSGRLQYSDTSVEEARTSLERAQEAEAYHEEEYNKALDRDWEPQDRLDSYYDTWQDSIRDRELAEMRLVDAEDARGASYLDLQSLEEDVARAERTLAALQEGVSPSYERALEDAERQLEQARDALSHAHLRAPWDGIVYSIDVAPAASVGGTTPIVTLINTQDGLRFVTQNLSEQHTINIRPGQPAVVTLRAFAETPLDGTVVAVVPQSEQAGSTEARFTVHIQLASTDLFLLPGLTGRVDILTEE
jgi:multidrug efflux pump subunit AcrA (membrane-fusion protein)